MSGQRRASIYIRSSAMFSLVITIISILLVGALAIATVYYGGSSFNNGGQDAKVATVLNESQQVQGALTVYKAQTGGLPTGTSAEIKAELISSGTLQALPAGSQWEFESGFAVATGLTDAQCIAVNKKAGLDLTTVPACSDVPTTGSFCCSE